MKPVLVGGAVDKTAGTLTAPDLDFSIQWDLEEELTKHLYIEPTDLGESGQYTIQVSFQMGAGKKFERKKFECPKKSNFFPLKLFSSKFFMVHMEAEVLQQWQTTHFRNSKMMKN